MVLRYLIEINTETKETVTYSVTERKLEDYNIITPETIISTVQDYFGIDNLTKRRPNGKLILNEDYVSARVIAGAILGIDLGLRNGKVAELLGYSNNTNSSNIISYIKNKIEDGFDIKYSGNYRRIKKQLGL